MRSKRQTYDPSGSVQIADANLTPEVLAKIELSGFDAGKRLASATHPLRETDPDAALLGVQYGSSAGRFVSLRGLEEIRQRPDPLPDPILNADLARRADYKKLARVSDLIHEALAGANIARKRRMPGRHVSWTHKQLREALPHLPARSPLKKYLESHFGAIKPSGSGIS